MEDVSTRAVWEQLYCLLQHHQKKGRDNSPNDVLNRLFHEYVPQAKQFRLNEQNCYLSMEVWSTTDLANVTRRHDRREPREENCPVVVLLYGTQSYMIDGNNRVNRWVTNNKSSHHNVVVVRCGMMDT